MHVLERWVQKLTKRQTYGLVGVLGFLSSGLYALYVQSAAHGHAGPAAMTDLAMMLLGTGLTTLWAIKKNDWKLLVMWDVCSAIGTYLMVRFGS